MLNKESAAFPAPVQEMDGDAPSKQVAAICFRQTSEGKRVLLITSRDTGRWIVPKGWPIEGLKDSEAALQEAWEEAGVSSAKVERKPLGSYRYDKVLDDGTSTPVLTDVYLAKVKELAKRYPEAHERKRVWFTPKQAAKLVDEPELKGLIRKI